MLSIFEYDQELIEKKCYEAEYEHGRQDGYEVGIREGIETGRIAVPRTVWRNKIFLYSRLQGRQGSMELTVRAWIVEKKAIETFHKGNVPNFI